MRNNKTTKFIIITTMISSYFSITTLALAEALQYTPLETIGTITKDTPITGGFTTYATEIFRFGIGAMGILAVGMLTYAGILYITSTANEAAVGEAKKIITGVFWGLFIGLTGILILNTINPKILDGGLTIDDIPTTATESPWSWW